MKKNIITIVIIVLALVSANAQDLVDAIRYSNYQLEGTARAGGMGNAFGALGGDFTSVSINPAGLGLYRAGELTVSPYFSQKNTDASYLNSTGSDNKYNFAFSNISYVSTFKAGKNNESGLVSINFGIGYNRLKDFNGNSIVKANNSNSSFLDHITENANANDWNDYYEQLASDVGLLLYDTEANEYWHDIQEAGYGHSQQKTISKRGSLDEYTIALGLNFSHKFYAGISLGIQDLYYKETSQITEWDTDNSIPYLDEYQFNSYLRTTGTGYNGKLGIIYKPTNEIRLGASIHTPTFFNLNDNFDTYMSSVITYDDGVTENLDAESPFSEYDYHLETPFKATFSGAFIIAKKGLLSFDYEYVNYSKSKYRNGGDGYAFVPENNDISVAYKSVGNIRIGGEYRLTNTISARAGYELYPSAYNKNAFNTDQPNANANNSIYSAGLGYKQNGFFMDVAFRHQVYDNYNFLYPSPQTNVYPEPEMVKYSTVADKVICTIGFKF